MGIAGKLFGKYLLVTNTVSCGLMMGVGDMIQQRREHFTRHDYYRYFTPGKPGVVMAASPGQEEQAIPKRVPYEHDYARTRNMMVVGFLQGPFHHYFYAMLDRILPGKKAGCIAKKTLLDQLIASPTCLAIFFVGLGVLENRDFNGIYDEIRLKLCDTWKVDCCFWPPTQCVNFLFVPLHYRVLYINFMTMIYDMFLSYIKYDARFD